MDTIWSCIINFRSGLTKEFEGGDVTALGFYYFNNTLMRVVLYICEEMDLCRVLVKGKQMMLYYTVDVLQSCLSSPWWIIRFSLILFFSFPRVRLFSSVLPVVLGA